MKKPVKSIRLIFIILILLTPVFVNKSIAVERMNNNANASTVLSIPATEKRAYINLNPENYKPASTTEASDASKILQIGNIIIRIIQLVASPISVIVLMIIGIKYMMGSVEEKAEYKKTMMPYIIGCFLVFGITNILGVVVDIVSRVS